MLSQISSVGCLSHGNSDLNCVKCQRTVLCSFIKVYIYLDFSEIVITWFNSVNGLLLLVCGFFFLFSIHHNSPAGTRGKKKHTQTNKRSHDSIFNFSNWLTTEYKFQSLNISEKTKNKGDWSEWSKQHSQKTIYLLLVKEIDPLQIFQTLRLSQLFILHC